jgi:signal transduction histidine kinase
MAERLNDRADYITTFAAHVSHELKSPLTSIQGAAELLRDAGAEMSDAERKKFLDNIVGDARRLTALLDRLRELARADNPRLGESTTLAAVIAALRPCSHSCKSSPRVPSSGRSSFRSTTRPSCSRISPTMPSSIMRRRCAPRRRRRRRGGGDRGERRRNDCRVQSPRFSRPFFTTRRESGGTGMGLEIVLSTLRAHNGAIRLVSSEQGAAFEVVLPAA